MLTMLGQKRDSKTIQEFEKSLESSPITKQYGDVEYVEYKTMGICLVFETKNKTLDSINLYNKGCYGYEKYMGTLPCDLNFDMTNSQIVNKLGEPDKKGGNDIPVWISYESMGLQIDFVNKSFDDVKNPISCITMYKN